MIYIIIANGINLSKLKKDSVITVPNDNSLLNIGIATSTKPIMTKIIPIVITFLLRGSYINTPLNTYFVHIAIIGMFYMIKTYINFFIDVI